MTMFIQKEEKKVLLGNFTPYRIDNPKKNIVQIGFIQSARLFTLDLNILNGEEYLEYLKQAMARDIPVKVLIFDGSNKIAEINKATMEAIKAYRKAQKKPI